MAKITYKHPSKHSQIGAAENPIEPGKRDFAIADPKG